MLRAKAMGDYLRFRNVLPKRVSEMVILITAREWTQQYEWAYHYGFALRRAWPSPIVEAIAEGRRPEGMKARTRPPPTTSPSSCIARGGSATPPMRARSKLFGEQGIIDLIGVSGYYTFNAMMMNVARSKVDHRQGATAAAVSGAVMRGLVLRASCRRQPRERGRSPPLDGEGLGVGVKRRGEGKRRNGYRAAKRRLLGHSLTSTPPHEGEGSLSRMLTTPSPSMADTEHGDRGEHQPHCRA